jgi:hypothetical protein
MSRLAVLKNARERLEMGKREARALEERFRAEIREVEAYRLEQVVAEGFLRAFSGGLERFGEYR